MRNLRRDSEVTMFRVASLIIVTFFAYSSRSENCCAFAAAGRHHPHHSAHHRDFRDRFGPVVAAASQHVGQVMGYHYPVPASSNLNPLQTMQLPMTPPPVQGQNSELGVMPMSLPNNEMMSGMIMMQDLKKVMAHSVITPVPIVMQSQHNLTTSTLPSITTAKATSTTPSYSSTSTTPATPGKVHQQVPAAMVVMNKPTTMVVAQTTSVSSSSSTTTSGPTTEDDEDAMMSTTTLQTSSAEERARLLHAHHSPQVQKIDVACGKEKMTVRVSFDQPFGGVIYAKGHYSDPNCRFTSPDPNQGQKIYQFEMVVGQCGVAFIDSGLTSGGHAYVEGMLVIILEPGVQEAWDAARRIRCLWEGNIDQTVTYPLSINMLESQTLTFSGDTASASLEIQNGRGPRAPNVQGLVRVGELLTAVVNVQGDPDFDLLVKNCVATDGTPNNRIVLSDNHGCAIKPKLMGGWQKQKNPGGVAAYAYLSAFKFPDIMDLFLECTVSLCKGQCEECPTYLELHVPSHEHDHGHGPEHEENPPTTSSPPPSASADITSSSSNLQPQVFNSNKIDVRMTTRTRVTKRRTRRNAGSEEEEEADDEEEGRFNRTSSLSDSLRLRRVVHVVGPDDLPDLPFQGASSIHGPSSSCPTDCFSALGIVAAVAATFVMMLIFFFLIFGVVRRHLRNEKC